MPGALGTPVIAGMTKPCQKRLFHSRRVVASVICFVVLLGLIGFTAMGPDSLLSGACAMDVGNRRQAAVAAGVINGLGSVGAIVQEPVIGWLKQNLGLDSVFLLLVGVVFLTMVATGLLVRFERGRV